MKYFVGFLSSFLLTFFLIWIVGSLSEEINYINANAHAIKMMQAELHSQKIRDRAAPELLRSVVPVVDKQKGGVGMGSAVAVGLHTLITAYHVVDGATEIRAGNTLQPAKVVWHDKLDDIAYLHTKLTLHPVRVFRGKLTPGQRIVVVGDPLGLGMIIKDGRYQDGQDNQHGFGSAAAWPGMSGGGVFCWANGEWKLAGITQEIPTTNSGQMVPLDMFYLMSALGG